MEDLTEEHGWPDVDTSLSVEHPVRQGRSISARYALAAIPLLAPRLYDLEAELIPGGEPSSRFEDDLDAELILDGEPISHPTPHPEHTQTLSRPHPRPHPDQAQTSPRPRSDHSQTTSQTQTMPRPHPEHIPESLWKAFYTKVFLPKSKEGRSARDAAEAARDAAEAARVAAEREHESN